MPKGLCPSAHPFLLEAVRVCSSVCFRASPASSLFFFSIHVLKFVHAFNLHGMGFTSCVQLGNRRTSKHAKLRGSKHGSKGLLPKFYPPE